MDVSTLVDRFLAWPLPAGVCSDLCVIDANYASPRSGTNLLTADEARQMIEYLLAPDHCDKESGWLIERRTTPVEWWAAGPQSRWEVQRSLTVPDLWTYDPRKAVRFARREDAEMMMRFEGFQNVAAVFHKWN